MQATCRCLHAGRQALADGRLEGPATVWGGAAVCTHGHALSSLHLQSHQGITHMHFQKSSFTCLAFLSMHCRFAPSENCSRERSQSNITSRSPSFCPHLTSEMRKYVVHSRWSRTAAVLRVCMAEPRHIGRGCPATSCQSCPWPLW